MTGKAKFGFRIPKEVQALPLFTHPRLHSVPEGASYICMPALYPYSENSHLMAILGPTSIYLTVEFIIHKRVDSGKRPKQVPGLSRK